MVRAATVCSACLLGLIAFACAAPRPAVHVPPPPPLPAGQQSLEDLDRSLRGGDPAIVATVERSERLANKSAAVKVTVAGIGLVDPQMAGEDPRMGQGHLHYQIDDGPTVATTATRLTFQDLAPGRHTIIVSLAGNDHRPIGPKRILTVSIPADGEPQRSRKRATTSKVPAPKRDDSKVSAR